MKSNSIFITITIISIIFGIYILYDTFLYTESYATVSRSSVSTEDISAGEVTTTQTSYKDDNIEINIETYFEYDTYIYVADIKCRLEYLKTAFANDTYGKNVTDTTSSIAQSNNAILAINGDYYGVQESGYVLKNGVIYRNVASTDQEDLVIYYDSSWEILSESDYTLDSSMYQVLSFGPGLIYNSQIVVGVNTEVSKSMNSNPRTAIGMIDEDHFVFVVSDGRTSESAGLTLYELAEFMENLGVVVAYNLDGGGSSTMYFNGSIVNNPTSNGKTIKERSVSDIVYIGY